MNPIKVPSLAGQEPGLLRMGRKVGQGFKDTLGHGLGVRVWFRVTSLLTSMGDLG